MPHEVVGIFCEGREMEDSMVAIVHPVDGSDRKTTWDVIQIPSPNLWAVKIWVLATQIFFYVHPDPWGRSPF